MGRIFDFDFFATDQRPLQLAAALGFLGLMLATIAPLELSVTYGIILLGVLVGLCCVILGKLRSSAILPELMSSLLELSRDRELFGIHTAISTSLHRVSTEPDPIYRRLALQRLQSIADQCLTISKSSIEFTSTESWRVVYEELLRSPGLHMYRSVAYIESAHYWQDGPGQQSTRLNLELHDERVLSIERIAIIADHLWPESELFPIEPLHSWLDEQHRHGIWLRLVRESALANDSDLLADFGIYGSRAVGIQLADPSGRTIRFQLSFDQEKIRQAEAQWSRLAVYSISYRDLLDRTH